MDQSSIFISQNKKQLRYPEHKVNKVINTQVKPLYARITTKFRILSPSDRLMEMVARKALLRSKPRILSY